MNTITKHRHFVLTDIGDDPDDQMSMVRLMTYSNHMDIEGLVATSTGRNKDQLEPDRIAKVVNAFGLVRDNLELHEPGFPFAEDLAKRGSTIVGTAAPRCAKCLEAGARSDPSDRAHRDPIPALRRHRFQLGPLTAGGARTGLSRACRRVPLQSALLREALDLHRQRGAVKHPFVGLSVSFLVLALISIAPGCSSDSGAQRKDDAAATGGSVPPGSGGQVGSGGAVGTGGQPGSGGLLMTGGTVALGGIAATGGNVASGGTVTSGGTMGKGGVMATGGVSSGGAIGVGGTQAGGSSATGGKLATGGTLTTGGTVSAGGTIGTGGATGSGGVQGSGGNVGVGGARVDAGSTQGCQCTLNVVWSVPFDCYCADKPSDCEINYASYGPDAGASSRSYTGIKEYAGCNLAVVYDMDPMQDGNKYFDLTTGRLVGLTKTANSGINCPFGAGAGALVFGLGTGQTTVPESCARTACFASSREPSYCTN